MRSAVLPMSSIVTLLRGGGGALHHGLLGAALSLALPSVALAAPPEVGGVSVVVEGANEAAAGRLVEQIGAELGAALEREGVSLSAGAGVEVDVHVKLVDAEMLEYDIGVDIVEGGRRESVVAGAICSACSEQRLIEEVVASADELAAALEPPAPEPPAPEPEPVDAPEPVQARRFDLVASSSFGIVGIAGIGAISAGVVSLTFGALVYAKVVTAPPEPVQDDYSQWTRQQQAAGLGTLVTGVGLAALGVAGVVVDRTILERRRRLDMAFNLTPTSAGVSISGRF